jgi:hypothetical protein
MCVCVCVCVCVAVEKERDCVYKCVFVCEFKIRCVWKSE